MNLYPNSDSLVIKTFVAIIRCRWPQILLYFGDKNTQNSISNVNLLPIRLDLVLFFALITRLFIILLHVYEENIIPIKIAHLAEYVSKVKRISLDDALVYIYVNPMYERLYDENAKWWYLSTEALYEEFELRRIRQQLGVDKTVFELFTTIMVKLC